MAAKTRRPTSGGGSAAGGATTSSAGGAGRGNAARAARIAAQGTQGGGSRLPHFDRLQAAFGHHDLSGIQAHTGSTAQDAAANIDAEAFAYGTAVAFGTTPDLHLAAEEVTHVLQQSAGQAPSSGLGQEGDAYEVFANQVADRVVAGESVEAMIDTIRAPGTLSVSQPAVQRRNLGRKEVSDTAMGRLNDAQSAIDEVKSVLSHGAGNQKEALEATNFNSYFRMAAMRDRDCWVLDPSVYDLARQYPNALTAAKAELAQGGNCGEHAAIAYDWLRANTSHQIHKSAKEGLDHAFVVIGDADKDGDDELVVSDPWPTAPTACLWEDHFAFTSDRSQLNRHSSTTGNGEDVKSAIAAGLSLSAKGMAMVRNSLSEERTKEEIKKGTEGDKPWIWEHPDAASRKYTYETAAPAPAPAPDVTTDTGSQDLSDGESDFLGWLRQWLN